MLFQEFAYEFRIPQLACYSEIFAATPQSSRFAAFDCGRDAFGAEIILFTSGNRDEPVQRF